jgi:hypothetical protein
MHRGLPWSCSRLPPSTCAGSDVSSGPCSTWSITKHASLRLQHNCNAWGANSDKMPNRAPPIHVNPYTLVTNLPIAFFCILVI